MLVSAFPKLQNKKFVHLVRTFFRSPYYCALIAALMAVSELFALELPVYYIYLVLGTACILLCEDALGIMPIACCGYMTFSARNNPGFNPKKRIPKLAVSFLALGVAYLLGGVFSGFYAFNTVLYGFVQIVSLSAFYFFFYYTVDWRTVKASYFAVVFTAAGVGMLAEVVGMYFLPGVIAEGVVRREALLTGWGVYNNVGCIMAMCMPAPFYFAATKKHGWIFSVVGCLFFLGVVLTQSRSSILFGAAVFLACIVAVLILSKKWQKLWNAVVFGAFAIAVGVAFAAWHNEVQALFHSLIEGGMNDSGRIEIYKKCWATFRAHPFFGVGFYKTPGALLADGDALQYVEAPAGAFIPPRAHNTVLQLLASGGAVALMLYLCHRTATLVLFFRKPTAAKTFAFFCVAALLLTSLLDCNFFNIGPGILYALLLVCAECTDPRGKLYREKKRGKKQEKRDQER